MNTLTNERRWRERAACRGLDTSMFFPGQGESVARAKAICGSCAVRAQCGTYALDSGQRFGIWGGQTERDRRQARAARRPRIAQRQEAVA